jgi:hypothetical protein
MKVWVIKRRSKHDTTSNYIISNSFIIGFSEKIIIAYHPLKGGFLVLGFIHLLGGCSCRI